MYLGCFDFLGLGRLDFRCDLAVLLANLHQLCISNAQGKSLPRRDLHPDTGHRVLPEVCRPPLHNLWIRIPSLDYPFVDLALEILLALFVCKRTAENCPEGALCGERDGFGCWDPQRRGSVCGKVGEEVEKLGVVGPEVDVGDGHAVCL